LYIISDSLKVAAEYVEIIYTKITSIDGLAIKSIFIIMILVWHEYCKLISWVRFRRVVVDLIGQAILWRIK
jgi:hypothetical protein